MKSTLRVIMFSIVFFNGANAQQKVQFSQYMFSGIVINPAYAGADEALSLTFINRQQWRGVENAPVTQTFSGHTAFKKKHVGTGVTIINDKIGVHRNLTALSMYAYHLKVAPNSYLSMGLQAGIHNQRSDYASLMGNGHTDPKVANSILNNTFLTFGTGIYFRGERFHAGFSIPELLPERVAVNDTLSIKLSKANFFLFSKYRLYLNETLALEPSFLLKHFSNLPVSFDVNANLIIRSVLTLGLSYRKNESIDFLMKGQVTPQLQFGYAYDHTIGTLSRLSNGSHELMINYIFKYVQSNVSSPR